jgi:hypothetical protein
MGQFGIPFFLVGKQNTSLKNGTIPLKTGRLVTLWYTDNELKIKTQAMNTWTQ